MLDPIQDPLRRAAEALLSAHNLAALTGAGISVESGISPFRGPGGLWTKYGEPDKRDYQRFLADPKAWWETRLADEAQQRRPELRSFDAARPNPAHVALAQLEQMGILQRLITQNVDGLHLQAGSRNVTEIHGNRYQLRCIACGSRFPRQGFPLHPPPPHCPDCDGVLKFDTVMFGEPIPGDVLQRCRVQAAEADCMLVVGTSAVVYPAAELPLITRQRGGVLIEVNPHPSALTSSCDVVVQGRAGEALPALVEAVKALG